MPDTQRDTKDLLLSTGPSWRIESSMRANQVDNHKQRPGRNSARRPWRRVIAICIAIAVLGPALAVTAYRFVPPPLTPLMLIRATEGHTIDKKWVRLAEITPSVAESVIAREDNLFCQHWGFDWSAIREAYQGYRRGERLRGASTITMQTAKNLFLWPGRSFFRKGLEAYFTVLIEAFWPKSRILEIYLNIAEWGPGIYGIERAATTHFGVSADQLSRRQAAQLATILPNPRLRSPHATDAVRQADIVLGRVRQLGPILACVQSSR